MRFLQAFTLALAGFLLVAEASWASDTDELLKLLSDKGVINADEASSFKEQLKKEPSKKFEVVSARQIELSGYAQARYQWLEESGKKDSFDVRRARLTLKGKIGDGFSYKFQEEFGGTAQKLLDAEIAYEAADFLKISAGQFKIPFSLENLEGSDKLQTINRSQVVEALVARGKDVIGNQNGRDTGLKLHGSFFKGDGYYGAEYAIGAFNGAGINAADTNEEKDYIGRLIFRPARELYFGGSHYTGKYTLASDATGKILDRGRTGFELGFVSAALSVKGEWIQGKDNATESGGWFLQTGYFLVPDALQGVLKYDTYDPNTSVSNDKTDVYTLGFNYHFNKLARLQVNYELKNEEGTAKPNNAAVAQLQVGF